MQNAMHEVIYYAHATRYVIYVATFVIVDWFALVQSGLAIDMKWYFCSKYLFVFQFLHQYFCRNLA